ncbi:MAG: VIT1/CCC1 transporter family protein [Candidatus Methanomethylophilaceae archaeon]|jgi:predicted membrane protein (TIGR00267 family)
MAAKNDSEGGTLERWRERLLESDFFSAVDCALKTPDTIPAMRRYFVNTVFDSTFVILGIIIGMALSSEPSTRLVVVTIITSCVALMISTGISVFEAERLEQSIRIQQIEKVMLRKLDETSIKRTSVHSTLLISLTNCVAPIITGTVTLLPFLILPETEVTTAAWISIALAISILFSTGMTMGRMAHKSPYFYGLRMAGAGVIAFVACYMVEYLL